VSDDQFTTDPNEAMVSPASTPQLSPPTESGWHHAAESPSANATDAPRSFASSSSFFSAKPKIVTEDVYFPEKDMWLRFRAVTQAQFRRAQTFCYAYDERNKQRAPDRDKDLNIAIFIVGAVDHDGNDVFQLDSGTYKRFLAEPYSVINRGSEIVARLSGIGEDVVGKQRRKDAFDDSGSDDES
jgi:hypothetical protein